jgi:hypothetical protein
MNIIAKQSGSAGILPAQVKVPREELCSIVHPMRGESHFDPQPHITQSAQHSRHTERSEESLFDFRCD